ncbi:enoyl-CoA hydratase/isomerase family protein [Bradyrhizobium sp. Tv2a-2]|uniref:enoyl-CoA hydratase/isomerase family protein n=1 Tax=Bradyrhizobium sp. Tv2a-2 TaxID=113395 RepID=UPI00042957BA|nr:enoyl-CoA hydratase/isomerase family protein [Bradyrhizobium sp. Tv2a-2]
MSFVRVETRGPIASVTLDHPVGNRINFDMREELRDAFNMVARSEARVLIVRGEGADFCLGGDVRDWPGVPVASLRPRIEVFAKALDMLEQLPIPTVAAVQGTCMGGGFELALSCDMIVAARSARFAFTEARLGIMTLQGGMMQIAARVGRAKAAELVFLSDFVGAEQMAQWNVINRVVDDGRLDSEVTVFAQRLADGPPGAYAGTKTMLRKWARDGEKEAKAALYGVSMPLFETEDVQAALRNAAEAVNGGKPFPKATFSGN